MKKLMLSIFALAAFGFSANAIEVEAGAELIAPASIAQKVIGANGGDLQFGKVATGTDGTLILSAEGAESVAPTATTASTGVLLIGGTTRTLAAFTVTGQNAREFTVTLPASAFVTGGSGVYITTFTSSLAGNIGTIAGGTKDFYVGATLVLVSATPGTYVGTYDVTVQYN